MFESRLSRIRGKAEEGGLDALLMFRPPNIYYFTGFDGGELLLVPLDGEPTLLVRGVDLYCAEEMARNCNVRYVREDNEVYTFLREELSKLRAERLGYDSMGVPRFEKIKAEVSGVELVRFEEEIWGLRMSKSEEEISRMREAAEITSRALSEALEGLKEGIKEGELAASIEYEMWMNEAHGTAFPTIVASGARSSYPHPRPPCGNRRIRRGEPIVIDVGAKLDNYCADMTRTLVLGRADEKLKRIFEAVEEAQRKAIDAIEEEVEVGIVDRAARSLIEEGGYGDLFVHSTGHGIGLEVHEPPRLSVQAKGKLSSNFVVTVEPGIYVKGYGGVRIEDMALVKGNKCELLTKFNVELEV